MSPRKRARHGFGGSWGDAAAQREKENAEKAKTLSGDLPAHEYEQVLPKNPPAENDR